MWNRLVPHLHVVNKIWNRYLRSEESQPHTRHPSPGFQCQEDKSPQLLATKTNPEIESMEETSGAPSSSSYRTHTWTHLLRLTPSKLQCGGSILEGTSGILGETEGSDIEVNRSHCLFSRPPTHRATELAHWCHI